MAVLVLVVALVLARLRLRIQRFVLSALELFVLGDSAVLAMWFSLCGSGIGILYSVAGAFAGHHRTCPSDASKGLVLLVFLALLKGSCYCCCCCCYYQVIDPEGV